MPRRSRLDKLVELAVVQGQLHAGAPLKTLQARVKLPVSVLANADAGRTPGKALKWTQAEDEFLTRNLAYLSEAEIAQHLGRTVVAVHLRWKRDLRLTPLTKLSDCITTQKAAETLGVDPKAAMRWVDMGLLPGRRLPMCRVVRSIRRSDFRAWVLDPRHWIYFKPQRVRDPELRRMLHLRRKRWGDEWLTVGQAARLHGVCIAVINNALHDGRLTGVKWGNWHLLRSEVMKPGLTFYAGKGGRGVPKVEWSERADAFLVLAAALGHSPDTIARLMGGERSRLAWTPKRAAYRLTVLKREGRVAPLIRKFSLRVQYRRGLLSAEWEDYRRRFKDLARAKGTRRKCDRINNRAQKGR